MRTRRVLLWRAAAGAAMVCLPAAGCGLSRPDDVSTARTPRTAAQATGTARVQPDAPYPADMDHLDDILAIGKGHDLPQGAQVTSVSPATNFAASFPGGWGYVIAFTATDTSIRDYVTTHIGGPGKLIERYPTAKPEADGLEDIDLSSITNPWKVGFGDTTLLLERPPGPRLAHHPRRPQINRKAESPETTSRSLRPTTGPSHGPSPTLVAKASEAGRIASRP